jgi:hypothetical protein
MTRRLILTLGALAMLTGCAGARLPKLAKCAGPYRYANPYGTVLPTLPIPGQPAAPASAPGATPDTPPTAAPKVAPPAATPPPAPSAPAAQPAPDHPGQTSALPPLYPSC